MPPLSQLGSKQKTVTFSKRNGSLVSMSAPLSLPPPAPSSCLLTESPADDPAALAATSDSRRGTGSTCTNDTHRKNNNFPQFNKTCNSMRGCRRLVSLTLGWLGKPHDRGCYSYHKSFWPQRVEPPQCLWYSHIKTSINRHINAWMLLLLLLLSSRRIIDMFFVTAVTLCELHSHAESSQDPNRLGGSL